MRKFPPTVVAGATPDMAIMQEEIFGPLLPVLGYRAADEPISYINKKDRPSRSTGSAKTRPRAKWCFRALSRAASPSNDCLFHFTQVNRPMGGVGASGSGAYHGERGFRTFSKLKPVFYRSVMNRMADLYPPYGGKIERPEKMLRLMS